MTTGDSYREFDNASIVTTSGKDTVSIRGMAFRKRDLILGGIAIVALLLVIILAIVLAVEVGNQQECSLVSQASAQTGGGASDAEHPYCITPACLRAAFYEKQNMKESVDPCEDFYTYACGGFAEANPQTPYLHDVTPRSLILQENINKLVTILGYPVARTEEASYERKLREFMQSCTNHFDKMQLAGKPLIEKVIKPFGGWYVLNNFDPSNFNFHTNLKKVHIETWTTAIFKMTLTTDQTDWNKAVIELDYGGLTINFKYYGDTSIAAEVQKTYKLYMKQVASMLVRDAGLDLASSAERIDTFVQDVYEVEHTIAKVILSSPLLVSPHEAPNRLSVHDLTLAVNNTIDFLDYFQTAFPNVPQKFSDSTLLAVLREGFFHKLGPIISGFLASADGTRKIHNYFVWRLISHFSQDLSWEYIHAERQLIYELNRDKQSDSGYVYCFNLAEKKMPDAMSALFIKHFYKSETKAEAWEILESIKSQLLSGIEKWSWMSPTIRTTSQNKIKNSLYKIGYPDFLVNDSYVDSLYSLANISESDYFGNVLALIEISKKSFRDALAKEGSKEAWAYHIYDPKIEYYNAWHELIATSAFTQNPLFDHLGPDYYNYGGIGSLLGAHLTNAVDQIGRYYGLHQRGYETWWDNVTIANYNPVRQCAIDVQYNETMDSGTDPVTGQPYPSEDISFIASDYTSDLLADINGLTLAFNAYKQKSPEKMPPGFPKATADQMFFVAFAQAHCQNSPHSMQLAQLIIQLRYPNKNKVNLAVSQVPRFRQIFNCTEGQRMAPQKTCSLEQ